SALGRGDVEDAHCHGLRSGCRKKLLGPLQTGVGVWLGGELAGLVAVLQLVDRPGRQPDAEGAVMVLTRLTIAGPVIRGGRDSEALAGLAIYDAAPGQGVMAEAHDADQIRRLLLDDYKPIFLGCRAEHRCGAVKRP